MPRVRVATTRVAITASEKPRFWRMVRRVRWLAMQGSVYTQNTPLHPLVGLLRRLLASQPGGSMAEQLDSLLHAFALAEASPLFASLLDLPGPERSLPAAMPPERKIGHEPHERTRTGASPVGARRRTCRCNRRAR